MQRYKLIFTIRFRKQRQVYSRLIVADTPQEAKESILFEVDNNVSTDVINSVQIISIEQI
jgi:hypothetical protein